MKVSVIITCHNYGRFLSRAIRSALSQSFDKNKYEIIVIDDASSDETQDVMASYAGFIRPIILKENVGLAQARNIGIKSALGQYIINLDADDYFDENILYVESLFLSLNNNIDAVTCDYYLVGENEQHIKRLSGEKEPIACGVMFRKDLLIDIGLYDESFQAREEEELIIRFLKKYTIYNINLPLYRYRKHKNNLTNNIKLMEEHKKKIIDKHKKILVSHYE